MRNVISSSTWLLVIIAVVLIGSSLGDISVQRRIRRAELVGDYMFEHRCDRVGNDPLGRGIYKCDSGVYWYDEIADLAEVK